MTQPADYCSDHQPLVAYGEVLPGVFEHDADLAVREVQVGAVKTLTQASGRLFAGEVRSAIPGDPPIRERLTRAQIELRYPPYKRFAVGTQAADPSLRQYVALGYMSKPTVKFGAAPNNVFWHEGWRLDSELASEATAEGLVLQGQYRVSEDLAEDLGDEWWNTAIDDLIVPDVAEPITPVRSEPLCFNPEGRPNRFRRPIRVIYPGRYGESDQWVKLYVFTDPDGPHAESWTYHQALQYLWYAAMQAAAVRAGNLFDASDLINLGVGDVPTYLLGPEDVTGELPGWLKTMVRHSPPLNTAATPRPTTTTGRCRR